MYTEKELVGIAKRENNNKRNYLVVNKLQGKHVPVSPKKALDMFGELADLVKNEYKNERILLVGFAETATAIGAELAVYTGAYYMQTTREDIEGVEYLYFSESHSHATEQKLIKTDLDKIVDEIDRIVFVEDEVTTGNTILNIINVIKKEYAKPLRYAVASLLNGMNVEAEKRYNSLGINMHYLVKTEHDAYGEIAESYKGDGEYVACNTGDSNVDIKEINIPEYINARRLCNGTDYATACENMWESFVQNMDLSQKNSVLVVGTEEFMYPALFVAGKIEEEGINVRCHSTTRSPIALSMEKDYPLHTRYQLASLYDKERTTFIYDIGCYDAVYIITDSVNGEDEGVNSLVNAITLNGNSEVCLVRWC